MYIKLANNVKFNLMKTPIKEQTLVNDTMVNSYTFTFGDFSDLSAFDMTFTEDNCETVTIVEDDGSEFIYKDLIRTSLEKRTSTGANNESVNEINVVLRELSYMEKKTKDLDEKMTTALLAITDLYEKEV